MQAKSPEPGDGEGLWLQNHKNVTYLPGGLEHNFMFYIDVQSCWKLIFDVEQKLWLLRNVEPFLDIMNKL